MFLFYFRLSRRGELATGSTAQGHSSGRERERERERERDRETDRQTDRQTDRRGGGGGGGGIKREIEGKRESGRTQTPKLYFKRTVKT